MEGIRDYFYDRDAQPITYEQYASLKYESDEYRRIGSDKIGPSWVSTVWLGFDHGWMPDRPPILFETMIFDGPWDGQVWRYYTEKEARAGHALVVELIRRKRLKTPGQEHHGWVKHMRDERRREMKQRVKELG